MELSKNHLYSLMSIKTPKWEKEIDSGERKEQIYDYCQLRNYTKDLLENPKDEA